MKEIVKIETPFTQKFGIPRQPLLIEEAIGKMVFTKNDFFSEAFRGIENFSHLWLIFHFHGVEENDSRALIYPPRLEGKVKLGVYATRTPHRPNRLGLSVVKFERIEVLKDTIVLTVSGVDLMNGTPIFDIKPYIPYCDSVKNAEAKIFDSSPGFLSVHWRCPYEGTVELRTLIEKVIGLDPRPAQDKKENYSYGVSVGGYNVRFEKGDEGFVITEMTKE